MNLLSNLLHRRDAPPGDTPAVVYRLAQGEDIRSAIRFILEDGRHAVSDAQIADFLDLAANRGINLNTLSVAEQSGRLLWTILPVISPGRTMLLLAPSQLNDKTQEHAAGELTEQIISRFAAQDVHLTQVLLDPSAAALRKLYDRCGFTPLAELLYLHSRVKPSTPPPTLPQNFTLRAYCGASHALFAQTIASSYQNSLDCPALNGRRDIEDVIAGHKAAGEFDPNLWIALLEHDVPRAVLLLSRAPHGDALELVYLGLVPEARGRGLGDVMMRQAMAMAARRGRTSLSLAVDSKNAPALKLYYRHGLRQVGAKIAMVRELTGTGVGKDV